MEKIVPVSVSLLAKDKAIALRKNGKRRLKFVQTPLGEEAGFYLLNYYGLEKRPKEKEKSGW